MKKEKQIKTHQRRTKGGKTVIVRAHKAKYDAAEELKKSLAKKKGAGDELESRKKQAPIETPDLGFTDADFKEWYHWDQEGDPKNKAALKVEKALIAKMGKRGYNKYFDEMSDGYSARGHAKAYKSLVAEHTETPTPKTPKTETSKSKKMSEGEKAADYFYKGTTKRTGDGRNPDYSAENFERASKNLGIPPMKLAKYLLDEDPDVGKKLKRIVGEKEYIEELSYGDVGLAIMNGEWKKSKKVSKDNPVETEVMYKGKKVKAIDFGPVSAKEEKALSGRLSPKETDDFLSGKPGAISPKPATLKDVMGVKLPRANKFGESSVEMSAKQRNAAIEKALNSGWKVESSNEYSSGKWMLLTNGEHTMSIHTGRDKIFNDVVITKAVTPKKETPVVGTTEKISWGHTSKEKGKSVRTLGGRGQINYAGITSSGLKLPKKFSYDSDTRSDWYDSFRTKDSASIENVVSQAKKAKWQKGGSGKMVRYTSPDGRVHILVNKGDKSASIFYR